MVDPQSAAKIRDLEQRMAAMPGSRIFVGLAEEYRRAGRFGDALATLRNGLEAHPGYLSARIAIARLFQEMGRNQEAMDAFTSVLASDRENLVASKALAELHARLGNAVEAVKKYKLYRALAGDRSVDGKIAALEQQARAETAAAPAPAPEPSAAPEARMFDPLNFPDFVDFTLEPDTPPPLSLSTLDFEPSGDLPVSIETTRPFRVEAGMLAEPASLGSAPAEHEPSSGASVPLEQPGADDFRDEAGLPEASALPELPEAGEALADAVEASSDDAVQTSPVVVEASFPDAIAAFDDAVEASPDSGEAYPDATEASSDASEVSSGVSMPEIPPSRTLAALYERQGFAEDARRIYERLEADSPGEGGFRSPPAAEPPPTSALIPRATRREALERWLSRVKANAAPSAR